MRPHYLQCEKCGNWKKEHHIECCDGIEWALNEHWTRMIDYVGLDDWGADEETDETRSGAFEILRQELFENNQLFLF